MSPEIAKNRQESVTNILRYVALCATVAEYQQYVEDDLISITIGDLKTKLGYDQLNRQHRHKADKSIALQIEALKRTFASMNKGHLAVTKTFETGNDDQQAILESMIDQLHASLEQIKVQ
jgi:hypothetical protein